jgi:hypothetical protein
LHSVAADISGIPEKTSLDRENIAMQSHIIVHRTATTIALALAVLTIAPRLAGAAGPPTVAIGGQWLIEGDAGQTSVMTFRVTLSPASSSTVTVPYTTSNEGFTCLALGCPVFARPDVDYMQVSGTLTFTPGQLEQTIPVTIVGDSAPEWTQIFGVQLGTPSGATLVANGGFAFGSIIDDDGPLPALVIEDGETLETDASLDSRPGGALLAFTVRLTRASAVPVSMSYWTSAYGTATAGADFLETSGTLEIPPGTLSKTLVVPVHGDTLDEADETFQLVIHAPENAYLGHYVAVGTILDDDPVQAASPAAQYRLYHPRLGRHLYTADKNEYCALAAAGWNGEGGAYTMWSTSGAFEGTSVVPFYRLYCATCTPARHFWTTDWLEASVLSQLPQWFFEGTSGYLLPQKTGSTAALERLSYPAPLLHVWTGDPRESQALTTEHGWRLEGTIGYVQPGGSPISCPAP